jgi:uncharacterized protein YbbC (DUF1343 family)
MKKWFLFLLMISAFGSFAQSFSKSVLTGADQLQTYLPLLKGKNIALLVNQTSVVNQTHLVDTLLSQGVKIAKIFAPEHGFRGTGDAGEKIKSGIDVKTGLSITSMYGASKKPSKESMKGIEFVVFDIQDVGARFYTYISSLQYMMEACAEANVPILVLDRPNPNGFYVDGPILDTSLKSFVGMQAIPIVHGMTVGEYANMLNGESLLSGKKKCSLKVIACKNYDHKTLYELPIAPSPNLKSMTAIYLYPSLCLFEGTDVSVGRGTKSPFETWGHPSFPKTLYSFTPVSTAGAKSPPHENKICYGENLSTNPFEILKKLNRVINIYYIQNAFAMCSDKTLFFNSFLEKLVGTKTFRQQILSKKSSQEIRKSWESGITKFKMTRKKYLLYKDFE